LLATALAGLLALLGILAGCAGPTTPHWGDNGVHAVAGYWILAEQPCDLSSLSPCVAAVHTAESTLGIDSIDVSRASTASLPRTWIRADGQAIAVLDATSGSQSEFVVIDLADGTRRVIGFGCLAVPDPSGVVQCLAFGLPTYEVGSSPVE
jgi:hypothetical protein